MENFDIKKYLVENKLTSNSKTLEQSEAGIEEGHSTSHITHKEGKEALEYSVEKLLGMMEQLKPGASFNKNLEKSIRSILISFGQDMMDLGEELTQGEISFLSSAVAEE